jgi:hypothetical protein
MKRHIPTLLLVAVLVLTAAGTALGQGDDPRLGRWNLNVAKSKYSGAKPKSETRTYTLFAPGSTVQNKTSSNPVGVEVLPESVKMDVVVTDSDGSKEAYGWLGKTDGKDYPFTGLPTTGADTQSIKRVDANTFDAVGKEAGKDLYTERTEVSTDGKTMTITTKGKDADGKPFNNLRLYDAQ